MHRAHISCGLSGCSRALLNSRSSVVGGIPPHMCPTTVQPVIFLQVLPATSSPSWWRRDTINAKISIFTCLHILHNINMMSFEAFTAVMFQAEVFLVVTLHGFVVGYQSFRGPCCLHLHLRSTGLWCCIVLWYDTNVSEVHAAFIFTWGLLGCDSV
jgi:hypothetical protein